MNKKIDNFANAKQNAFQNVARCVASCFMFVVLLILSFLVFAPSAHAKTLAEFDVEIAAQENVVAEKQATEKKARAILEEATTWYYKNINVESLVDIFTGNQSLIDTIAQINCMDSIHETYSQKASQAQMAKREAEQAAEALESLKNEKSSRAKSLANAKQIQFPQGNDAPWSGLKYWTGTVARSGCGLCAYTVVIDELCGKDYTPTDMLSIRGDWKGMDGYPDDHTGSGSQSHKQFTKSTFDVDTWNIGHSVSALKEALSEKETAAIICSCGYSFKNKSGMWRYSGGHFIAVTGYDEEGFHVSDSAYSNAEGANVIYSDSEISRMLGSASSVTIYSN